MCSQINKKLKSFTLSEMLVVLIITAIIVGLAFSVLNVVRKQVSKLQSDADERVKYDLLKSKLFFDFNKYPSTSIIEKEYILFESELDSSTFIFKDNLLISHEDTLMTKVADVKFYNKGTEVYSGKIDAIKIDVEEKKEIFKIIFAYRHTDATDINEIK